MSPKKSKKTRSAWYRCQDCNRRWRSEQLVEPENLVARIAAEEPVPAGECPKCHALCHREGIVFVVLNEDELYDVVEGLDDRMYWQLSDERYRRDGYVVGKGSDDPANRKALKEVEKLHDRLNALYVQAFAKRGRDKNGNPILIVGSKRR